ncbi:DNA cytosine methyltransferase [Scytonema hofmannii FACHB-248]|uniref:DNA (cytosine-5-)-methyltransferase n=2 Tax=Cyanophyceae TaxID=3028117 RepID=A0ABR8GUN5_9CYAN|nr:DNA cytosine methyltransferase [Scytonema hofmannii FACHB-248]
MNSTAPAKKIAVSLFSGVGGFDLGFKAAGFEIAIAIDNNPIALATYQHNFPHATVLCKDIRREIGNSVPPLLAYAVGMQVREHLECNTTYQIKCQNWQNCLFLPITCNFKNLFVFVNEILSLSGLSKISKERPPPHLEVEV